VVKSELMMLREALRDQLNKEAGAVTVKDIIIH